MSIRVMSDVWANSKVNGASRLLLLLAIADFADDHGFAFPSVKTLAKKSRMTPRNAQNILAKLCEEGALEIYRGCGPRGCNRYRVKTFHGAKPSSPLHPEEAGGETAGMETVKSVSSKPSEKRQEPTLPRKRNKLSKAPIPDPFLLTEEMRSRIHEGGFGDPDAHHRHFVAKCKANNYKYADWSAAFEMAVFKNWAGLPRNGSTTSPSRSATLAVGSPETPVGGPGAASGPGPDDGTGMAA